MGSEGQKSWRRNQNFRRWEEKTKAEFPQMPDVKDCRLSVKQIAFFHAHLGQDPSDIVVQYPRVSLTQVHLALAFYNDGENRAVIDAEIKADQAFAQRRSLDDFTMSLPSMRHDVAK